MESLTQRQREILSVLIRLYLDWGEPVASADIADAIGGKWSSATIRKELKILEDMGYLEHPYKVAGRYPTVKAYRWFFNRLIYAPLWDEASLRMFRNLILTAREASQAIKDVVDEIASSIREMSMGTYVPSNATVVDMVFPVVGRKYIVGLLLSTGEFVKIFVDVSRVSKELLENLKSAVVGRYLKDLYQNINDFPEWFADLLEKAMQVRVLESGIEYLVDKGNLSGHVRELITKIKKDDWYNRIFIVEEEPVILFSEEFTAGAVKDWMIMVVKYTHKGLEGVLGLVGPRRYSPERIFETLWAAKKALEDTDGEAS